MRQEKNENSAFNIIYSKLTVCISHHIFLNCSSGKYKLQKYRTQYSKYIEHVVSLSFFLFFFFKSIVQWNISFFQTRFWFILEVPLNIRKIPSSQTSTVQRPFWGRLSFRYCRKRPNYSLRQGRGTRAHPGPMHATTDQLWRCPMREEPSSHTTTHKCCSAQVTMKNSNAMRDKHHWLVCCGNR